MRSHGLPPPDGGLLGLPGGHAQRPHGGASGGGEHEAGGGPRVEGRLREEVEVGRQGLVQLIVVRELCECVLEREKEREKSS